MTTRTDHKAYSPKPAPFDVKDMPRYTYTELHRLALLVQELEARIKVLEP